jgi:glycolate oxidase
MKLPKEAYQAFEDIVGPEYVTQEPVILDTYNQVWGNQFFFDDKHSARPSAVLLPATTKEVQAIVRVCNKHGILFKAFSSGFEYLSLSLVHSKAILLDLKRMNRVIEIDRKNMRAVVEPYVSVYRLQLEAAKYGLFTGRIGVGYSAGVIASSCCHHECSHTMVSTSGYGRNILGCEWVLPTGELLNMGSGEDGGDCFSADGPGFSLRGVLRGRTGANGGHGVITKASVKLYPWYGPPEWRQEKLPGEPPVIGQIDRVPDGFRTYIPTFSSVDVALEAAADFCREEILYALSIAILLSDVLPEGNDEQWAMISVADPEFTEASKSSLVLVIGGQSDNELSYKEKCIMAVAEKWGGRFLPHFNEQKALARAFIDIIWSTGQPYLRITGDFLPSSSSPDGSPDMLRTLARQEAEIAKRIEESGAFFPGVVQKGERFVSWRPEEHLAIGAQGISTAIYDPFDPASLDGGRRFINELFDPRGDFKHFGIPSRGGCLQIETVTHVHQNWGHLYDNYDQWLMKIKQMLDPNTVGDWTAYIPPEYPGYKKEGNYVLPSYGKEEDIT